MLQWQFALGLPIREERNSGRVLDSLPPFLGEYL